MSEALSPNYFEKVLINSEYLSSLLSDIQAAKQTIDMEYYIFEDDEWGKQVAEALCAAALRGVKIRLIVDGIGTPAWGNGLTLKLEKANITTHVFHALPWAGKHLDRSPMRNHPFFWKIIYYLLRLNIRDHRKICIIDKKIVYVGSANIIKEFKLNSNECAIYRDTNLRIENINTEKLQYAFERAWGDVSIRIRLRNFLTRIDQDQTFQLNYSWRQRRILRRTLLTRIRNAKQRIWITNAYFIPTFVILKSLADAAKRGVDVKILLPHKYEFFVLSSITKTFYSLLLHAGVKIFEYRPCILHAKSLIIDDWFTVGSSNLNYRSWIHDLEVDAIVQTNEAKQFLENQYNNDLSESIQVDIHYYNNISLIQKLTGRLMLILKYWM